MGRRKSFVPRGFRYLPEISYELATQISLEDYYYFLGRSRQDEVPPVRFRVEPKFGWGRTTWEVCGGWVLDWPKYECILVGVLCMRSIENRAFHPLGFGCGVETSADAPVML
jgi:hypothetical protein